MNMVLIFVITPYKVSNHQEFSSSIVKMKCWNIWNASGAHKWWSIKTCLLSPSLKTAFYFLRISKIKTNESKPKVK